MRLLPTLLEGLVLLEPSVHADERGFFVETFRDDLYRDLGIDVTFVQDNHSRSRHSVVRGLHYQADPGQPKLIRVARGRIFDVAVDIRSESPAFGRHESFLLDDETHHQVFIPAGFAHGFVTLSAEADVVYKVGSHYDPSSERGLAWDDPDLGIDWRVEAPIVSERDRHNPRLRELPR